jgi:mannosyltransferase
MADNSSSPRSTPQSWRSSIVPLFPILVVAAALRIYMLGARSIWVDEGVSIGIARLPWKAFEIVVTRREGNMTLYYLLLRAWILLGDSEAWIRALSMIAGVAAVAGVYFIGRRLFSTSVACIASGILALNAYHIQYSQEARSYALLTFALTITTLLMLRCVDSPTWRNWTLFGIASGLCAYLHFFAVFLTAAQILALVLWRRRALRTGPLALGVGIYVLMLLPIAEFVRHNFYGHQLDWIAATSASGLYEFGLMFTGSGGVVLFIASIACVVAGIFSAGRKWFSAQPDTKTFGVGLIVLWLFFPMAITTVLSNWKHLFVYRYMTMCLPALALVMARGVALLRPKWQALALIILVVLLARADRIYFRGITVIDDDWRSVTQFIVQNARPGDAVIFNNGVEHPAYEYYIRRSGTKVKPRVIFPLHNDDLPFLDFEGLPNSLMFPHITEGVPRVWTVDWVVSDSVGPLIEKYFVRTQTNTFSLVRVSLYESASRDSRIGY